ncbi:MAG: cysteine desulfurase [Coriobacteriales bacterium]|jgi:cysteine desulfurase|nr:cysteine desulfurase [Coriobacteriales bacterium]
MTRVYLDYAATSPVRPEVFEAMRPWLTTEFGNASTLYQEGKRARQALDEARATIARHVGANPTEIVFTSGGTESNNALIIGITQAIRGQKGREKGGNHIVSTAFEHHAVLEPVRTLRREGYETTLIGPTRDGFITPDAFVQALCPHTTLASVMTAQNEIGTIQPLFELATIAHDNNTLLHTDAVQALGKLAFNAHKLNIDAASFSAHKLGGPQGVGAFYLKSRVPFIATQFGGGQESKRRGGTQNIAGAVGFAKALECAEHERTQKSSQLATLRDHLAATLLALDKRVSLTIPLPALPSPATTSRATSQVPSTPHGSTQPLPTSQATSQATTSQTPSQELTHLPNILSFLVAGFESETLILKLDNAGFAISGGSACSTGSLKPSHVLTALGIPRTEAHGVLRVSLGPNTTKKQIDAFVRAFVAAIKTG